VVFIARMDFSILSVSLATRTIFYSWQNNDKKVQASGIFCYSILVDKMRIFKGPSWGTKKPIVIKGYKKIGLLS